MICDNCGIEFHDNFPRVPGSRCFCSSECCSRECQRIFYSYFPKLNAARIKKFRELTSDLKAATNGINLLFNFKGLAVRTPGGKVRKEKIIIKKPTPLHDEIERGDCCTILKSHALILKHDPERLSTDFIKSLSKCDCDE